MEYARLVWRRYLADGTNVKAISMLEEQDALTEPASLGTSAALADADVPAGRPSPCPAMPDDEENWMMGSLVEVDAEE